MNALLNFLAAAFLAVVFGIGGTLYALTAKRGVQHVDRAPWSATIEVTPDGTNPYVRAVLARTGEVPMLATEAIVFRALTDDQGEPLQRNCTYTLDGQWMDARWWTMTVGERNGNVAGEAPGPQALNSAEIIRSGDGSFTITLAGKARPGNWITLAGVARPAVTLRLYDTPLYVNGGLPEVPLPSITRGDCT